MSDRERLKKLIAEKVFIRNEEEQIDIYDDPDAWIFDFRRIIMNGQSANLIADIFYTNYKDRYPFQLCALEIAGVPLLTTIMNKFYEKGHTDINAFFIRKSRKKSGLLRMIEGVIEPDKPIILVDDIINSGSSFWRQIEVLEGLGHKVDVAWSILRFRDLPYYKRFHNHGIQIDSLFELNDLTESTHPRVKNLPQRTTEPPKMPFKPLWAFGSEKPSLSYVVSKSQPILDETKIYFGSDNQTFWALNQRDGSVAWKYRVGPHSKKKSIFSSPALYNNTVIFGSYDGNVYCLDKHTGALKWISMEADWVGSSPAAAHELGLVFIGLEFGLMKKRGGIIALNADSGKTVWLDRTHVGLTHCSPFYLADHQEVIIGSNDGKVRLYDASTGALKWTFATFGGTKKTNVAITGFGSGDIKENFAYSRKHDYITFGSIDGCLYIVERTTGHLVTHYQCEFGIYSTPCIYKDRVYFTSVDKHVRCIDLNTKELVFEVSPDQTRIFSSPTIINDRLYVGTNAGRLQEMDPLTGKTLGYFQATERITNSVVYNPKTDTYFLPTYANEIIALQRVADPVCNEDTAE